MKYVAAILFFALIAIASFLYPLISVGCDLTEEDDGNDVEAAPGAYAKDEATAKKLQPTA